MDLNSFRIGQDPFSLEQWNREFDRDLGMLNSLAQISPHQSCFYGEDGLFHLSQEQRVVPADEVIKGVEAIKKKILGDLKRASDHLKSTVQSTPEQLRSLNDKMHLIHKRLGVIEEGLEGLERGEIRYSVYDCTEKLDRSVRKVEDAIAIRENAALGMGGVLWDCIGVEPHGQGQVICIKLKDDYDLVADVPVGALYGFGLFGINLLAEKMQALAKQLGEIFPYTEPDGIVAHMVYPRMREKVTYWVSTIATAGMVRENAPQRMKDLERLHHHLGFGRVFSEHCILLYLPNRAALAGSWDELRLERPKLPPLDIDPQEHPLAPREAIDSFLNHDVRISSGERFVHTCGIAAFHTVSVMLLWGDHYIQQRDLFRQQIRGVLEKLDFVKQGIEQGQFPKDHPLAKQYDKLIDALWIYVHRLPDKMMDKAVEGHYFTPEEIWEDLRIHFTKVWGNDAEYWPASYWGKRCPGEQLDVELLKGLWQQVEFDHARALGGHPGVMWELVGTDIRADLVFIYKLPEKYNLTKLYPGDERPFLQTGQLSPKNEAKLAGLTKEVERLYPAIEPDAIALMGSSVLERGARRDLSKFRKEERVAIERMERIGFGRFTSAAGDLYYCVPARKTILDVLNELRQEDPDLPSFDIGTGKGIAGHREFVEESILKHDVLQAEGIESLHDTDVHVRQMLLVMLVLKQAYITQRDMFRDEIANGLKRIDQIKEMIAQGKLSKDHPVAQHVDKMVIAIAIYADLLAGHLVERVRSSRPTFTRKEIQKHFQEHFTKVWGDVPEYWKALFWEKNGVDLNKLDIDELKGIWSQIEQLTQG